MPCLARCAITSVFFFCVAVSAGAQALPDTVATLPEIRIEATRAIETEGAAPVALTVLRPEDFRTAPASSLQDLAARAPGLWLAERGHFALGERIVIRGVGARSPFGARGVQVFYDGIPLTMPDGQAITDIIDPLMVRRVELIRGPSAVYWGNASGGTLAFATDAPGETTIRVSTGAHARRYVGGRTGIGSDERRVGVFLSHASQEGHRAHSDGTMTRAGVSGRLALGDRQTLGIIAAGALQDVRSPGALTSAEYDADPSAANPSYVRTASGKWSRHLQTGLRYLRDADASRIEVAAYGVLRDLENPLPFAFIDVGRLAGGVRGTLSLDAPGGEIAFGADVAHQSDDRRNFTNEAGERSGAPRLDQQENVTAAGASAFYRFLPDSPLRVTAGARLDRIHYAMTDRMPRDVALSGSRTFAAVSPSVSVAYLHDVATLHASAATSFETPTTTELVNNPTMEPGFNTDLNPERTYSFEVGARVDRRAIRLDAAAFVARIDGRIASFRTEAGGDRDFFRNADPGTHVGGELGLGIALPADLAVALSYAALRARVGDDGESVLPAVPPHQLFSEIRWSPGAARLAITAEAASAYFADDANVHRIDGFAVVDARAGVDRLAIAGFAVSPFIHLRNVFDRQYVRSVVVNASFGRFYEPAPGRMLEAGLTIDL